MPRVQHTRFPLRALQLTLVAFALIASTEKTPAAAFGTKTALVMLVSLTNAPIDCSIAEVNGFVFTNSPLNVDSYFDHSTWGNVHWSGNVIAVTVPYGTNACSQDAWADAADSAALGLGYNPANYTSRVYAFPSVMGNCGYALATGNRVMNWHCTDLFAYGHEIGHSIGLHHASTDHNNDGVIENEYGGLDDCMGGESFTHNAPHKIWGGWLPQKAANGGWRQITTNGTYQISPLEINPTNNPPFSQALKIVPPTGWPYFLSYRQALDFDQGWTAAQVGKDGRSGTVVDPTLSMNSYPYAAGVSIHRHSGATGVQTLEIAVLADNQQFVIPGTGIVIRQISHDANQVTLNITGFSGGTAPLGVTFYQDSLYGGSQGQVLTAGSYTLSQLSAKGVPNDWASSCKVPSGWTISMYQNDNFSGTIWTLTTNTPSFSALSPSANDQMSSLQIVSGPAAPPPVPTELSAIAGNAQVRLSWTATPGATGYNVKRATVSGGPYSPVATPSVSSYLNVGLTNGVTYYYVVSATNSVGASSDTAQVIATPVNDLVGRWKFDENSGTTTADSSGNNNVGSLVNGPAWVAGKVGPAALSFTAGSLQSVTATNSSSLNSPVSAITLAAWVNANDWSGNRRILQKGNSDNQYRLLAENGVLKFHLSGVDSLTVPLPPTLTWMHIAATWDGSLMTLYTNGVQRTNLPAAGSIATTSDLLAIAKKNTSGVAGDYFNGKLDDVRIYNRALSAAEIAAIMTNALPVFPVDPFAKANVNAGQTYSGSISTNATDPDADALVFSKISGPAWLTVAANGTLGGTPFSGSAGTNTFTVRATDTSSAFANATMYINVSAAPPITATISSQGSNLLLSWTGGLAPYQVQVSTNLSGSSWSNLGTAISSNSTVIAPTNDAAFYRILGQ